MTASGLLQFQHEPRTPGTGLLQFQHEARTPGTGLLYLEHVSGVLVEQHGLQVAMQGAVVVQQHGIQVALGTASVGLVGRTLREAYQALDPKTENPRGSYSRRVTESLELDTTSRGSGSWDKVITSELDEGHTGPGSWRTRLLRFLRSNAEE